jgi:translation initiation factor 2B subunit (eIF-2B alpha/beta/delta family)
MYNELSVTGLGSKIFLINDNEIGFYLEKVDIVISGA